MLARFVPGLLLMMVLHPAVALAQASTAVMVSPFERRCAICHDNPGTEERAPNREALRQLTSERALAALTTGSMAVNAEGMTDEQKRAMAELVTGKPFDGVAARQASAMKNQCAAPLSLQNPWTQPQWNGWSPAPHSQWRFQPSETAKLSADQVPHLKLKWAFAIPGAGSAAWAQPTVVGGALFVGSDNNFVYALDARSGCVHWSFETNGQVRTAITIGDVKGVPGVRYAAYFGDYLGNVYAIDAETSKQMWIKRVDDHKGAKITGAPTLDPATNRLYPTSRQTCHSGNWAAPSAIPGAVFTGSRDGVLRAFSSRDGKVIWEFPTRRDFDAINRVPGNGGGFGGPGPTIVDGMLFTGSGYAILGGAPGNVLLAFGVE